MEKRLTRRLEPGATLFNPHPPAVCVIDVIIPGDGLGVKCVFHVERIMSKRILESGLIIVL